VPALPEAVELASAIGLDLASHRARHLADVDLSNSDLVLGFEQMHVSAAVVDGQAALGRTFTLPELVDLLQKLPDASTSRRPDPVETARERVEQAQALRAKSAQKRSAPEIEDPLGRPPSVQRRTAEEIRFLVAELAVRLFG
jgi:protein-tyrosine-phosphatase